MLTSVGVAGAIPAAYPKTIGPTTFDSFGPPDGGTRRSYNGTTDQYVDTHGGTWAAGGPQASLIGAGYTLKFQVEANNLEAGGPPTTAHIYRLRIGGASQNVGAANPATSALPSAGTQSGNDCKSPFAAPSGGQTVTGTISYGDYEVANTGNTMHQGIITLSYEYTRP